MKLYAAQMQTETGTILIGSGTVNGQAPLGVTQEEAEYLRLNYSGVTITERDDTPKATNPKDK